MISSALLDRKLAVVSGEIGYLNTLLYFITFRS